MLSISYSSQKKELSSVSDTAKVLPFASMENLIEQNSSKSSKNSIAISDRKVIAMYRVDDHLLPGA
jgi:hypothetical protein